MRNIILPAGEGGESEVGGEETAKTFLAQKGEKSLISCPPPASILAVLEEHPGGVLISDVVECFGLSYNCPRHRHVIRQVSDVIAVWDAVGITTKRGRRYRLTEKGRRLL